MKMEQYDVAVIGCGPAGVSAALYTARANLKTLVAGGTDSALLKAERIENYYGLEKPLSGKALFERGLEQLAALSVDTVMEEVTHIDCMEKFHIETKQGRSYEARAVVLCTGAKRVKAAVKNMEAFEGRGLSYCAVCDAFFYRNKRVGVLGSGAYALHEAMTLLPVAGELTLFTNGGEAEAAFPPQVKIVKDKLHQLRGEKALEAVELESGACMELDGLFVALGTAGAGDLARKLGVQVDGASIVTDANMGTMLPGLYAAGDCTGGLLQVSTAVAEGTKAALSAISFLRKRAKEA